MLPIQMLLQHPLFYQNDPEAQDVHWTHYGCLARRRNARQSSNRFHRINYTHSRNAFRAFTIIPSEAFRVIGSSLYRHTFDEIRFSTLNPSIMPQFKDFTVPNAIAEGLLTLIMPDITPADLNNWLSAFKPCSHNRIRTIYPR